jgi:ADP-ribosyl-[dinitrogen reductase] hydrolase
MNTSSSAENTPSGSFFFSGMKSLVQRAEGGLLGLLVGDAVGVPYEFHRPEDLPPRLCIDLVPPEEFPRSYSHIAPGTWSDDGAQALCLLDSLLACGGWDLEDFARRLLSWSREGYLAVDGRVFDIGIQTGVALNRLASGIPPARSGLQGERNNGNGSLMRTLPLALFHRGDDEALVGIAHAQSSVTHAHPRSQACCALYALWARYEMRRSGDAWAEAVGRLRGIYAAGSLHQQELEERILPFDGALSGSGYVVDCLHSARAACLESDFGSVVRAAIAYGNDTDTTACVAGGIAGIRHGREGIPAGWIEGLRGRATWEPMIFRLRSFLGG